MRHTSPAAEPSARTARLAGALYLSTALTAPFALLYVPKLVVVRGDPAATMRNLLAHETLFRLGLASHLVATVTLVVVVLLLHRLFVSIDRTQAAAMAVLFLVSVPISLVNMMHELGALTVARGADLFAAFADAEREALATLLLRLSGRGVVVAELFWGLWLVPLALLVLRSGFLPRLLGLLLLANAAAYVAQSMVTVVAPESLALVQRVAFPLQFGELWFALWLLLKGIAARAAPADERPDRRATSDL